MAKNSYKMNMSFNMALIMLSLLLLTIAESRSILGDDIGGESPNPSPSAPTCETVVGVVSGDTCYDIAMSHKLETEKFNSINPNVNSDDLFIGQWLCVKGTA